MPTAINRVSVGRTRIVDQSLYVSRVLESLARRSSPQPPDALPVYLTDPDAGGAGDPTLAFLKKAFTWKNAVVATGAGTAAQVIWAGPGGKLLNIMVQTQNSVAISFYDNASAASGNVLYTVPANSPTGTFHQIQAGCSNGITAGKLLNTPALLVGYCEV